MTATIGADLPALARAAPLSAALICDGDVLDRATLTARVGHLAREIGARTGPGDGVALDIGNSPLLVEMFLACAVSGRQALVYDTGWPAPYRQAIDTALSPALTVSGDWPMVEGMPFPEPPSPDSAFYVGFTSGSTGLPKGYRRSHRSWIDSFEASAVEFGLTGEDVVMA
ncbi:MAG TPA: AMP-binding protein, partial [Ancylobacter sp.]